MTDFNDPATGALRLSNAERDEAVARLNASVREGRLNDAEFAERSAAARAAVTRADLAPIFADLALPPQDFAEQPTAEQPTTAQPAPSAYPQQQPPQTQIPAPTPRKGPIGGTAGVVAVSISPLVALVLFFLTGALFSWSYSWLWFLLVPLTGAIVYGAGTRDRDRGRDR